MLSIGQLYLCREHFVGGRRSYNVVLKIIKNTKQFAGDDVIYRSIYSDSGTENEESICSAGVFLTVMTQLR